MVRRCLVWPIISLSTVIILMPHIPTALSGEDVYHVCTMDSNFTSNSAFQANLNLLLSSLPSATAVTGFSNDIKGDSADLVFGLANCRGDLSADVCRQCVNDSAQSIVQLCPQQRRAAVWYHECFLRYSDQSFFSYADTSYRSGLESTRKATEPDRFVKLLGQLMDELTIRAASNSSRLFATGHVDFNIFVKIYGLVQCTRDLSPEDCYRCLRAFVSRISTEGKTRLWLFGNSCDLRYDLLPFYNLSADDVHAVSPPPHTSPSPTTSTTTTSGDADKEIRKTTTTSVVVVVACASFAAAVACSVICFCLCRLMRTVSWLPVASSAVGRRAVSQAETERADLLFDLLTLKNATSNFSDENKLGEGGFGQVYKGRLGDGNEIAVKRLSETSRQGLVQMRNEVVLLAKLQHRNLVRLLGWCLVEQEKLLVYEFLPNSSLDKFLSDSGRRKQMDWERRYKIIEGVARGLLYLHQESRCKIIHRDLKASNVLLDAHLNPKISDFGLAKLFDEDETGGNTRQIAGTYGYMAPEYVMHGRFSTKTDVFSYGVLVLEIVTGRLATSFQGFGPSANLLSYVWQHWRDGKTIKSLDRGVKFRRADVLRCIHIGLLCVQEDATSRPSMAAVVLMLNSSSLFLPQPSPPAFLLQGSPTNESNSPSPLRMNSANDVTLSEMDPR